MPAGVCMHVHTCVRARVEVFIQHTYICTYTYNIVLVIVYEVPLHVLLEIYILVLSPKVTCMQSVSM